jgi:hypothetical protein
VKVLLKKIRFYILTVKRPFEDNLKMTKAKTEA